MTPIISLDRERMDKMYRLAIEELKKWKNKKARKPLIIEGARQVGKTWLMLEFGKTEYEDYVYMNFDSNPRMRELFASELDVDRLIMGLEIDSGKKVEKEKTLIIFDEVQEIPRALSSLKYFYENAPEYHIVCAGSLLGIALHEGTSFPVGKCEFLKLYPMTYSEFLLAIGEEGLAKLIGTKDFKMMTSFRSTLIEHLKYYYFVGGMPEAVLHFSRDRDLDEVREVQRRILNAYEQDFSKHAPTAIVPKLRLVWNSLSSQLAKENKKFIYGNLREGARAKDFETAIMWLTDCGLVHKVSRVNSGHLPLISYQDFKAFKLFMLDVGLLCCQAKLSIDTILDGHHLFIEFKGALTEQFVLQELLSLKDLSIFYYTNDRSSAEVDFVLDNGRDVIPMEVKAEQNLKAKSLAAFTQKFQPKLAIRLSMADFKEEEGLVNLPLYALSALGCLIE